MGMNILITGGAGFIGSNIAEYHLMRGDTVVAVDDLSTGIRANVAEFSSETFRLVEADLLEWEELEDAVAQADRIYHMAAVVGMFHVLEDPVRIARVNIVATERLLDAVVKKGHNPQIVIASSSSVYGYTKATILAEDDDLVFSSNNGGLTGYGLSKLINENQAAAYHTKHGLRIALPRLFNAAGPRQTGTYGFVVPRFVTQAAENKPLTVFGDGQQTRSFCDVRDVIRALDALAGNPAAWGKPVNVGTTREISILDLARLVIQQAGSSSQIEFVPFNKAYGKHFRHIMHRRPALERLEALADIRPVRTLERTIDDLLEKNPMTTHSGSIYA